MECNCTKSEVNIYLACRKKAAVYNDKLNSREMAAELLGISVSTLANYELGVTKIVPPDSVVMMSDLYKTPELKNHYCKYDCPIGKGFPMAVEETGLQGITVRILKSLDDEEIRKMKKNLLAIAEDGEIDETEQEEFNMIVKNLEKLAKAISELRLLAEKCQRGKGWIKLI